MDYGDELFGPKIRETDVGNYAETRHYLTVDQMDKAAADVVGGVGPKIKETDRGNYADGNKYLTVTQMDYGDELFGPKIKKTDAIQYASGSDYEVVPAESSVGLKSSTYVWNVNIAGFLSWNVNNAVLGTMRPNAWDTAWESILSLRLGMEELAMLGGPATEGFYFRLIGERGKTIGAAGANR